MQPSDEEQNLLRRITMNCLKAIYALFLAILPAIIVNCGGFKGLDGSCSTDVDCQVGESCNTSITACKSQPCNGSEPFVSESANTSPKTLDPIESSVDSNVRWQRTLPPRAFANGDDIAPDNCASQDSKLICANKRDNRVIIVHDCSDRNCRIAAHAHSSSRQVLAILVEYPQADARNMRYELFLGVTPFSSTDFRLLRAFPSGMPTPHSLLFVNDRLYIYGERYLAFFDAKNTGAYTVWSKLPDSFPSLAQAVVVKAQLMGTMMDIVWANNRSTGNIMQISSTFVEWDEFDSGNNMPMNVVHIGSRDQAVSMLARDNTDQYRVHWRCSPFDPIFDQPLTSSDKPLAMFWMPTKSGGQRLIMRFAKYIAVWLPNGKLHKLYNPLFDSSDLLSAFPLAADRLYVKTKRNYIVKFASDYGVTCPY
jgi:hypothetical protein